MEGWDYPTIQEICGEVKGSAPIEPKQCYELWSVPSFSDGKPEVVRGETIGSSKRPVAAGDVLLCKINPRINRVWVVGEPNDFEKIASTEWISLRPNNTDRTSPHWLCHYFTTPLFRDWITSTVSGTTGSHTRAKPKEVLKQRVPLPPLPEQERIVAILDEAFAAIETATANAEKNIENARELFESQLERAFSGVDSGGVVMEGWEQKILNEACILQRGYDLPKRLRKEGKFSLVSSSGRIDSHSECKAKGPGVVTGRSGSIGSVFFIEEDFWPLNTTLYVKEFYDNVPRFIYYLLKSIDLSRFASGAGVPTLNRNHVHSEPIHIPPPHEQERIVAILDEASVRSKQLEQISTDKLEHLSNLRQSLLQKAFIGELIADKRSADQTLSEAGV